ncbi:MAG TPA: hypothetical protein VD996_12845 [Chitinophagaceae bacterium]|nr:hypothetical protein [Chitinophagaceae bacterium]
MKNTLMAAVFALGLAACGNAGGDNVNGDSTTLQTDTSSFNQGATTDTAANNSIDTGGMLNDTSRGDRTRMDTSTRRTDSVR